MEAQSELTAAAPAVEPAQEVAQETQTAPETQADAPLQEGEIGISANGELTFGKGFEFFGQSPEGTPQETPPETEAPQTQEEPKALEPAPQPAFYTPEELGSVAMDAVDVNRLPEGAREYWPMVQQAIGARNAQIQSLEATVATLRGELQKRFAQDQQPQQQQTAPALDFKAISTAAAERAKQALGLKPDDDLEPAYDPAHQAAMAWAMSQVMAEQREQQAQAQAQAAAARERATQDQQEWGRFMTELGGRQDFQEFDQWFTQTLAKAGKTPADVRADFMNYLQGGGNLAGIRNTLSRWYQDFQAQKARQATKPRIAPKPPKLEGTGGAGNAGRPQLDLNAFSRMSNEEQGDALLKMGLW